MKEMLSALIVALLINQNGCSDIQSWDCTFEFNGEKGKVEASRAFVRTGHSDVPRLMLALVS